MAYTIAIPAAQQFHVVSRTASACARGRTLQHQYSQHSYTCIMIRIHYDKRPASMCVYMDHNYKCNWLLTTSTTTQRFSECRL